MKWNRKLSYQIKFVQFEDLRSHKEIKEILLDPEDGIIVRVNKNTFWRKEIDADEFKLLLRWKQSVTHAMWIAYTALTGIILKLMFWT